MTKHIHYLYFVFVLSNNLFSMELPHQHRGYWVGVPEYSQFVFPGDFPPETLPRACRIVYRYYVSDPSLIMPAQHSFAQAMPAIEDLPKEPAAHVPVESNLYNLQELALVADDAYPVRIMLKPSESASETEAQHTDLSLSSSTPKINPTSFQDHILTITPPPPLLPLAIPSTQDLHAQKTSTFLLEVFNKDGKRIYHPERTKQGNLFIEFSEKDAKKALEQRDHDTALKQALLARKKIKKEDR